MSLAILTKRELQSMVDQEGAEYKVVCHGALGEVSYQEVRLIDHKRDKISRVRVFDLEKYPVIQPRLFA